MEENFSTEWNIKRTIFDKEWKKIAGMQNGIIVFRFKPWPTVNTNVFIEPNIRFHHLSVFFLAFDSTFIGNGSSKKLGCTFAAAIV